DVAHLLRSFADNLDWSRLLARFGRHWRVLLAHLVLFGYIYPARRVQIPQLIVQDLLGRLQSACFSGSPERDPVWRGTLLSRSQYLFDLNRWGDLDARLEPRGRMTLDEIHCWTAAIDDKGA